MSALRCFLLTCLQRLLAVLLFCLPGRSVIQVSLWLGPPFRSSCPNYVWVLLFFLICTACLLYRPFVLITQLFPHFCCLTWHFGYQLSSFLDQSRQISIMEVTAADIIFHVSLSFLALRYSPRFFKRKSKVLLLISDLSWHTPLWIITVVGLEKCLTVQSAASLRCQFLCCLLTEVSNKQLEGFSPCAFHDAWRAVCKSMKSPNCSFSKALISL